MPFKKGICANPNGRPKKDVNTAGAELRETMVDFLKRNFSKVICDFEELPARERVRVYCELFRHAVPRLKMLDNKIDFSNWTDDQLSAIFQDDDTEVKDLPAGTQKVLEHGQ